MNYVLEQAVSQVEAGAQVLDVNVGAPGVDEPALMPKVVKALQSVTSLPLQLDSSNVQALENGLVDFAVVTTPVALKKPLQRIPLYSFREILIGGEEYAETASNKHCLQDLQDIPLIGIAPGSSTRELYTQYFMRHNLPFSPDMEVATTDQIFPMVQHNLGIGFFREELAAMRIISPG